MEKFQQTVHLLSDSSGETVTSVSKACMAQFPNTEFHLQTHLLIKNVQRLKEIFLLIRKSRGIIFYSLIDLVTHQSLKDFLAEERLTGIDVLFHPLEQLSQILQQEPSGKIGGQHVLDSAYYRRISAMQFAQNHDDGQNINTIARADVIIFGVSRSSKTPTCMYLAHRGLYAANVPLVENIALPQILLELVHKKKKVFFGLYMDAKTLVNVRRHRQIGDLNLETSSYTDLDKVKREVVFARRFFETHQIMSINVTARSIEETAARIIHHMAHNHR